MKKIIFWLDMEWIHFGIAKFMSEQLDFQAFAILDTDKIATSFYKEQDLMKFEKIWFYREYINKMNKKPDIEYLKHFEEKYDINLWKVAYSERFFHKYNPYYKFEYNEILSILENECRLFEKVLDEVNPDYLVIKLTDTHQSHLFHQLCKAKKIPILMMSPTYFANHFSINEEYGQLDELKNFKSIKERTLQELQEYLKSFRSLDQTNKFISDLRISQISKVKKYFHTILKTGNKKFNNSYIHYGRTRLRTISKFLFLKRWYRKKFIDSNFQTEIYNNQPFIYYPLHVEPERTLILGAPFYMDQLALISRLAKAIPVGHKLYVKEHGVMSIVGWREISFYKKILGMPNVVLLHPSLDNIDLLRKCSLLATIRGTSGLEAIFFDVPTIIFADVNYENFPSVYRVKNYEELPEIIRKMIGTKVDINVLNEYVERVEKNSFKIDLVTLYPELHKFFFKEFNFINGHISPLKMKSFLENHSMQFEQIALEHLKKIN